MFSKNKPKIRSPEPKPEFEPVVPMCHCKTEVIKVEIIDDWDYPMYKGEVMIGKAKIGTVKIHQRCVACGKKQYKIEWDKLIHTIMEID